jgi:alpha-tubulin suppressor-like RCC1 family protein
MLPMNKSPGIRKWLARFVVAAALILLVLLAVVHQLRVPPISVGKPLPPGKVQPQLVNVWDEAVLLAPDGSLWARGGIYSSLKLLITQLAASEVPRRVGLDSDWMQVAGGSKHTVALKSDGSLWAWGTNSEGQMGRPDLTHQYGAPARIGTETNWCQICCGISHSLALKKDGSLWAWGWNRFGQLGDGTTNNLSVPTMIGQDRDWRTVAASAVVSYAIKSNGTLWAWGQGGRNNMAPVQIGFDTNWLSISAADYALLALKTDGTLWLHVRDVPIGPSFIVSDPPEHLTQIGQDNDWIAAYATGFAYFARKGDGSWWVCGQNRTGQLGVGTNMDARLSLQRLSFEFDPWAFAPGVGTTLLLGRDGKLWTWGRRVGWQRPGARRQKIDSFLFPLVKRFPSLRFLIKSDIDREPHLLWELPPEVRRSLGTGRNGVTNNLTASHPADASHE